MNEKESSIPSNEEIINDLTRGLEKSCVDDDEDKRDSSKDGFFEISEDSCAEKTDDKSSGEDGDVDESKSAERGEDFVDEEALKTREMSLNETEKEELRADAETLKNEGNTKFKASEYREAMLMYTQALQTCPLAYPKDRAILFANRAAAKCKYDERLSAIEDCTKAIELNPMYIKAYQRRAQFYEQEEKLDEALEDFKKILEFDPQNTDANYAVRRLPPLIQEKNEKLKQEMLGKLKDLGNMILKPFGLSTDCFKMEQDPSTGGYSVKFNNNQTGS